ncbi:MAG: FAD-binding oxidoreductase [Bacteroidota bacterium]
MAKKTTISNWGNYPRIEAEVAAFGSPEALSPYIRQQPQLLARGNGRCYGDAALNDRLFSTLRLNKFLDFDPQRGELECQSGVLFADIIQLLLPQGFFLPVTPGTKFITVGGAIAADIHGKNHHSEGCFSRHLIHFDLMNGAGEQLRCSRSENPELFWNTVGGMGLTGIILSARFQLKRIETAYIRQESLKAPNLEAVMQLFEESADWTYTVAWIDCLQRGRKQGRSLLMRGEHARLEELPEALRAQPLSIKPRRRLSVPFHLPSFTLNTLSVKAFNWLYYHRQRRPVQHSIVDYDSFFYPLDAIHHWNRIYGRRGFTQYQLVLPKAQCAAGLPAILDCIREAGQGSFLCVLKLFGPKAEEAIHSFPIEGYTLALDFKINKNIRPLIAELDKLLLQYGGKVYLAKDAFSDKRLSGIQYDFADAKFTSIQRKRLD